MGIEDINDVDIQRRLIFGLNVFNLILLFILEIHHINSFAGHQTLKSRSFIQLLYFYCAISPSSLDLLFAAYYSHPVPHLFRIYAQQRRL